MSEPESEPAVGGAGRYLDTEAVYRAVAEVLGEPEFWALSPHEAGLGNETLFLVWGDREFVVRRPPLGGSSAPLHDVGREYRVLDALAWTDLPTPAPVTAVEDPSVAGAPFTVVERLGGKVLRHGEPMAYIDGDGRPAVGRELIDTLAAVHAVEPGAAGLGDLGRRPADRLAEVRAAFRDHREGTDRPVPGAERVGDRLADRAPPAGDRTVVHGDATLANLAFTPRAPPEVVGVLDWERAGVGDPLVDLGRALAFWFETEAEACGLPVEVAPRFTVREGYDDRADLVARYESVAGRSVGDLRFARALALFEAAATFEGYYRRQVRGEADRAAFAAMEAAVPALVDRAERVLDGAEPL